MQNLFNFVSVRRDYRFESGQLLFVSDIFHTFVLCIIRVAFDIIYFGAIIGTIVIVILDNRNPVKTMAWILILMFLPVVGLVFYFFFGRSQRREKIIGKKSYDRLLKKPMAEYLAAVKRRRNMHG